MRHIYRCPLRWADMDAYGHVNNAVFLRYLEEARVDMLFTHAQRGGGERLAEGVVIARHEIDYKRPLIFRPEPVRIETWVTMIRHASFGLAYEVRDDDVRLRLPIAVGDGQPPALLEHGRDLGVEGVAGGDEPP